MSAEDRYEKRGIAGEGTFGVVYRAWDKQEDKQVAIKKLRMGKEKEGIDFTALREIKVLRELNHPNILRLIDVYSKNGSIHLVLEFLEYDLESVIRDSNITLTEADRKAYMKMVLQGVEHLHTTWTLHRDLKPNNLLISSEGILKLADFGFARQFGSPDPRFTSQVVTRWYRAPELLFGARAYGPSVDIWAVGCIFAELMLRSALFPGSADLEQLSFIFRALGTPTEQTWPGVSALPDYVSFNPTTAQPFNSLFSGASDIERDLLSQMLKLDPLQRISAADALQHPWFSSKPDPTPHSQLKKPLPRNELDRIAREQHQAALREQRLQEGQEDDGETGLTPLKRKLAF